MSVTSFFRFFSHLVFFHLNSILCARVRAHPRDGCSHAADGQATDGPDVLVHPFGGVADHAEGAAAPEDHCKCKMCAKQMEKG